MNARQPAVAGTFYPSDPVVLTQTVQNLLNQAKHHHPLPKAIIVPHAGYIYSGAVAASAYASFLDNKKKINKIVMLGPAHTLYFKGIAYDPVDYFLTPLGAIEQDKELLAQITGLSYVYPLPKAHSKEHCLEVQWPFCQVVFPHFTLLPLVVGDCKEQEVAHLLERVWGDEETLIIISSDLSHYLPYEIAQKTDAQTCLCIDTLDDKRLSHQGACGYFPLRGFLHYAKEHQLYGRLLDLRNSGDTAGSKERVVGYAAYHFYQNLHLAEYCHDELLNLAKEAIQFHAKEGKPFNLDYQNYNKLLQIRLSTFVTLYKNGMLRGCMGSLHSQEHLAMNVVQNALRAGFADPRFPKLTTEELDDLSISISILNPLIEMKFKNEEDLKKQLRPKIDGLVLIYQGHQATFLPSVWETLNDDKEEFLQHLKLKMGLAPDFWSPEMKALRYTTEMIQ